MKFLPTILLLLCCQYCSAQSSVGKKEQARSMMAQSIQSKQMVIKTPDQIWGKLFKDVQLSMAMGDNKTFTDAIPKASPELILKKYNQSGLQVKDSAKIRQFVLENFRVPVTANTDVVNDKSASLKTHLEQLWSALVRKSDVAEIGSSLLPLPKTYIVPGGRFREIYYWDSYFTMLGLAVSNRYDLIENMLDNFQFLINTYGHIPNGNRSYYLGRSQPPYFALMVALLHDKIGDHAYKKYFSAMKKEYEWWMEGSGKLNAGNAHRRVVKLKDGSILNRYFDDVNAPRQESYLQDVETANSYKGKHKMAYTHLRAGAESGWDFSSRWFADTIHLNTIETANILPVDLNCLLYAYENILTKAAAANGLKIQSSIYQQKALSRKKAILAHFWSSDHHFFFDYQFENNNQCNRWSLAGVLPLFVNIATKEQAGYVKEQIEDIFLKDGGVVTTPYPTGQQWDAPNGWAPLQYLAVKGLSDYDHNTLAKTIADRWMSVNEHVYENTGKMLEKYNVENIHLPSGGGEYPTQDGFGWSNGVYLKFYSMFR